jgi:acyl-CoA synthetase (AMP-forming)/AMP-acid ligase II
MTELIIFTVIITLVLAGVGFWLQLGMKAEIGQRRRARDWPKTTGTVTNSQVEERTRRMIAPGVGFPFRVRSVTLFKPVISYSYQVAGQSYQSSRYKNGLIIRSGEWVSLIPKVVEKIIAEHPQGRTVTVIYNPDDPAQAYLELDTSVVVQFVRQMAGFLVIAAAACLFVRGAYLVGESLVAQSTANKIPAAIPAITEEFKNDLARDLGMTCQVERSGVEYEIVYTSWDCETPSGSGLAQSYVGFYSREAAPDKIDFIHALTGETDQQKELVFFVTVSMLAVPSADSQLVQDWLAQNQPTLTEMRSRAEIAVNGVQFVLSNPNGIGLVLEIGEIK